MLKEDSRNKQLVSFKLHAALSSMMESPLVSLHPAWGVNHHPFFQHLHAVYAPHPLVTK